MQIVHVTVSVSVSICMSRNRVYFLILSANIQMHGIRLLLLLLN